MPVQNRELFIEVQGNALQIPLSKQSILVQNGPVRA